MKTLTCLRQLTRRLASAGEDQAFEAALDAIDEGLGVDKSAVVTIVGNGGETVRAWRRLSEGFRAGARGQVPWRADERGAVTRLLDEDHPPSCAAYSSCLQDEGIRGMACVPLADGERLIGGLLLYTSAPRTWEAEALAYAETVAGQVCLAVSRARAERALLKSKDALLSPVQLIGVARQAVDLTGQLKTFAGRRPATTGPVDVSETVREAADMLRRLLSPDIRLHCLGTDEPHWVDGDPAHINQIIISLMINARDGMPGGGELTVVVESPSADSIGGDLLTDAAVADVVVVAVRDTGVGMDEQTVSPAFESYFTTKRTGEGNALGLATSHRLARDMGGCILVTSGSGEGSTFRLVLPAAGPATAATPLQRRPAPRRAATLLLVEDEEVVRTVLEEALVMEGYEVVAVGDAQAALDAIEGNPGIELVITDAAMPGMSGPELARRVRALRPDLKMLLMSGYVRGDEGLATELPFLQKPFMPDQLMWRIAELLAEAAKPGAA